MLQHSNEEDGRWQEGEGQNVKRFVIETAGLARRERPRLACGGSTSLLVPDSDRNRQTNRLYEVKIKITDG